MEATKKIGFTIREYLAQEKNSSIKHEYDNGEILAMSGGSFSHNIIGNNIGTALNVTLRANGKNCSATSSDQRVYIKEAESLVYPDAAVVCGKAKFSEQDQHALTNPILIVEVLSNSTKNYDRGGKFEKYRKLPSFKEYLLIYQDEPVVEVLTRQADGNWNLKTYIGLEETITLSSIGCYLQMADIYYRVPDLKAPTFRLFKEE